MNILCSFLSHPRRKTDSEGAGSEDEDNDNPAPGTQEAQEGASERRYGIEDGTSEDAQKIVACFFHFRNCILV